MYFGIILHDFWLPFGSLISVYEWSLEHVKMRASVYVGAFIPLVPVCASVSGFYGVS